MSAIMRDVYIYIIIYIYIYNTLHIEHSNIFTNIYTHMVETPAHLGRLPESNSLKQIRACLHYHQIASCQGKARK